MKSLAIAGIVADLAKVARGMFGDKPTKNENRAGSIAAALIAVMVSSGIPQDTARDITGAVSAMAEAYVAYNNSEESEADTGGPDA